MSRFTQARRVLKVVALAGVLAVTALVVPQSSVQPTDVSLVKVRHGQGVSVGDDVVWILAIGSDARPGQDMTRSRGDALQMVGINTRTGSATAIGVPRDIPPENPMSTAVRVVARLIAKPDKVEAFKTNF